MDDEPLYLGFDLSTQQLKAIIIQSDLHVVAQAKVDFDADLGARYGVRKGVLTNEAAGEVFAPVAMWLDALDLVFARLVAEDDGAPLLRRVRAISGSGQQHGSVWWGSDAERLLGALADHPDQSLTDQLAAAGPDSSSSSTAAGGGEEEEEKEEEEEQKKNKKKTATAEKKTGQAFSYPHSPNWQDHSTQAECDTFDAALGSPEKLAEVTGSSAHHRFTGPQILRYRRVRPAVYAATTRISLVSSFLASVLLGAVAPIDISDACGMNLLDMGTRDWSEPLLAVAAGGSGAAAAADLRAKLGDVRRDGGGSMGRLSGYFVARYGLGAAYEQSGGCQVAPFTGDNPATMLALPLRPRDAIVSLGTSTTFLMSTPVYRPDPSYHFFEHPTTPGQKMFMLCYKNGGLAREKVRDALPKKAHGGAGAGDASGSHNGSPWEAFNKLVLETPPLDVAIGDDHNNNNSNGNSNSNGNGNLTAQQPQRAKLGLYFYLPEIVPNIKAGTWRFTCSSADGSDLRQEGGEQQDGLATAAWSPEKDARAIVESQALSLRLRSQKLVVGSPDEEQQQEEEEEDGDDDRKEKVKEATTTTTTTTSTRRLPAQPRRVYLAGGGSLNGAIARTVGDVLGGAEGVYRLDVGGNACALGGAFKAVWATERRDAAETFDQLIGARWRGEQGGVVVKVDDGYKRGVFERYGRVLRAFGRMEERVLKVARNT